MNMNINMTILSVDGSLTWNCIRMNVGVSSNSNARTYRNMVLQLLPKNPSIVIVTISMCSMIHIVNEFPRLWTLTFTVVLTAP